MKHLLAIVLLLSVSRAVCSWAQVSAPENEVILSGVFVERNSTILSIHYDILLGTAVQSCQIGLFLSENGGVSFYEITSDASGDVGLTKKNGRKKILYDVSNDMDHLAGKPLRFKLVVFDKKLVTSDRTNSTIAVTGNILAFSDEGATVFNCKAVGKGIIAKGIVWSIRPAPTVETDNKTDEGTHAGEYSSTMLSLTPGVTYYYRAYATNRTGTSYGSEKTITKAE